VARPFATLFSVAEARLRHAGQRLGVMAGLVAACALALVMFLCFALAAATVALVDAVGLLPALLIMAGVALLLLLVLLAVLAAERRRERRIAARRATLDRDLLRAAAFSAAPRAMRLPGRTGVGLGLVALGALLVLMRRGEEAD
jgi:hypothetical protein